MNLILKYNPFERFNVWPNLQQLMNTTIFILLGKLVLGITLTWFEIGLCIVTGFASDFFMSRLFKQPRPLKYCYSGIVTSFALSVLLRSTAIWLMPLAVFIGVAQKYFLKIDGKHFQNPSNIGVLIALWILPADTYLDFKAWGSKYFALIIVVTCALLLLTRVKLFRLSIFLYCYYYLLNFLFLSDNHLLIFNKLTSTTFLLYSFFIINDPMALPKSNRYRFLHVFNVVSLTFFLELYWGTKDVNIPLGLFVTSCFIPVFRRLEESEKEINFKRILPVPVLIVVLTGTWMYFSKFNLKKNLIISGLNLSNEIPVIEQKEKEIPSQVKIPSKEFDSLWNINAQLFKQKWTNSSVFSVDLNKTMSNETFTQIQNEVSRTQKYITFKNIGFDNLPYAPIAAGDINQDGLLDIVVGGIDTPFTVLINQGENNFLNVSANMFDNIPGDIEHIVLADFNNDSFLDLLLINSQYNKKSSNHIWYFDNGSKKFIKSKQSFGDKARSTGGVAVIDKNNDGFLDFYISYGVNWHDPNPSLVNVSAYSDFYFESDKDGQYKDRFKEAFPNILTEKSYIGMTPLFTDMDNDNKVDFLLGNDFDDPSFILQNKDGKNFSLMKDIMYVQNTIHSMSFFTADFDSDGIFEIWENGISNNAPSVRRSIDQKVNKSQQIPPTSYSKELRYLAEVNFFHNYDCSKVESEMMNSLCKARVVSKLSVERKNGDICKKIKSKAQEATCLRNFVAIETHKTASRRTQKFDIEKFPKQLDTNVMLKRSIDGVYADMVPQSMKFSGWSWAGYPFDITNNGYLDLYITNGFFDESHNTNRLFINKTDGPMMSFLEEGGKFKVDFEDNSRGLIIADFDNDGDGDFAINNFESPPHYVRNEFGGDSIQFELRSKLNYYGIGSKIIIETEKMKQIREVVIGGIWNTSQPTRQHFGI
ncbi:MAG: hypothetical protein EP326_07665, partial [Deltaproteobacteria bacterium]